MLEKKILNCDLCVVGGGIAGMSAAVAAAREGTKVVLMHERPVLGGNASSEIRMCISCARGENNRETGLVEEIFLENLYRNPTKSFAIWDTVLYDMIRREENITLLLLHLHGRGNRGRGVCLRQNPEDPLRYRLPDDHPAVL